MSRMPHDFDALAAFFDPVSVAISLHDIFCASPAESRVGETVNIPAVTGFATVHDQELLGRLLSREVYDYWRQAGYLGSYCMTFMLRHAVTLLALAAHERACPACDLERVFNKYYSPASREGARECLEALAENQSPEQGFPLLGFSAVGIHFFVRRAGACRAFDAYDNSFCAETPGGLFCRKHAREAWWESEGPGASTQADMFRFFALWQNLYTHEERQLEELVGRFWLRLKNFRRGLMAPDAAVSEALAFFGYPTLADLCACGQLKLRRRYAELARQVHPDLGGGHESFLRLKMHYEVLRSSLCCALAAASA